MILNRILKAQLVVERVLLCVKTNVHLPVLALVNHHRHHPHARVVLIVALVHPHLLVMGVPTHAHQDVLALLNLPPVLVAQVRAMAIVKCNVEDVVIRVQEVVILRVRGIVIPLVT